MSELARGIRCERGGDLEGARDAYRRAMARGESHGGAGLRLLRVLGALGAHDDVLALADELDGKPAGATVIVHSAAIPIERARALLARGRQGEAIAAARDAVDRIERGGGAVTGPVELTFADAYLALSQALRAVGELEEAKATACYAVEHSPLRPDGWAELARVLAAAGMVEGALEAIAEAIELEPVDGELLYDQARYRATSGDRHGALQSLAHAIALDAALREAALADEALAILRAEPAFGVLTRST